MAMRKGKPEILSRPTNKRTSARMRIFLEAFEKTGSKTEAARIANRLFYR
jgi:hypothetical protein